MRKKILKPSEKFRFNFDWEANDDTSRDLNPLYNNTHEAALLFGRGLRAGVDRREQMKAAAAHQKELLRKMRESTVRARACPCTVLMHRITSSRLQVGIAWCVWRQPQASRQVQGSLASGSPHGTCCQACGEVDGGWGTGCAGRTQRTQVRTQICQRSQRGRPRGQAVARLLGCTLRVHACTLLQGIKETKEDRARDKERNRAADAYDDFDKRVEKHWTEKPVEEMTERDWRIFREDFSIAYKGNAGGTLPIRNWKEARLPEPLMKVRLNWRVPLCLATV